MDRAEERINLHKSWSFIKSRIRSSLDTSLSFENEFGPQNDPMGFINYEGVLWGTLKIRGLL